MHNWDQGRSFSACRLICWKSKFLIVFVVFDRYSINNVGECGMERHRFGKFFGSIAAVAWRERRERRLAAASSEQLRAAAGIRYGNFQFGQNLRIYPARGWYRVQDMYYARGRGCTPLHSERKKKMEKKGRGKTREKDTAKDEGGVCVWRVWRPLRRAGGGC